MGATEADRQPQVWRTTVEPVPDLPVPGPERDGGGTMGDTVECRL